MMKSLMDFLKYMFLPASRSFTRSVLGPFPGSRDEFAATVGDVLLFPSGADQLLDDDSAIIMLRQITWIRAYNKDITIEGHCAANEGTQEQCLALGSRRAGHVQMRLQALGLDTKCIRTITYGRERLVTFDDSEQAHKINRRVVVVIN
jgi:peptidoglycan-associated lipoprotein